MSNTRGYICAEPLLGYHSGWSEHGLCECWIQRPDRPNPVIKERNSVEWLEAEAWDACYTKRDKKESDKTWEILSRVDLPKTT